eukprot:gnl/Dysnectes_brevis/1618_a1838_3065.p1 GENE.gnl/Dysnectes_brevis/1618_a1838_3065~~gnl/Dysnectes_brevis/1618_a1838_3065.p1  ORF type:complete len:285 (+),score=74.25 gnl/Dysnectes_brevis/1618_a1838_3065:94-948(+)
MKRLETFNHVIRDTIVDYLTDKKKKPVAVNAADFDNIVYSFDAIDFEGSPRMIFSAFYPYYKQMVEAGANDFLASTFGAESIHETQPGFSCTIMVPMEAADPVAEAMKFATLSTRLQCLSLVTAIDQAKKHDKGVIGESHKWVYRPNGAIWVLHSAPGQLFVSWDIRFQTKSDRTIANVFLTELQDAQPSKAGIPSFRYEKNAPTELDGEIETPPPTPDLCGWLCIHVRPDSLSLSSEDLAARLFGLRHFYQYQLKATKAWLQGRMRLNSGEWLRELDSSKSGK